MTYELPKGSYVRTVDNMFDVVLEDFNYLKLLEKPPIMVMGRKCRQQRNVGFFSDESEGYRYSGQIMAAQPLDRFLRSILREVNAELGTNFNGILINEYEDGSDYISAHSDDERNLSNNGLVASIAYGAVRKFRIRDKDTKKIIMDLDHQDNQLLVMGPDFQSLYLHEIPKQLKVKDRRISLTFRTHVN
jgi:alkylated DNA repair dioxygenase AlkB